MKQNPWLPRARRPGAAAHEADRAWAAYPPPARPPRAGARTRSLYLKMRDGVSLALDVTLPSDHAPGERLPTMLRQTRYYRSQDWRRPLGARLGPRIDGTSEMRERFVRRGYAWVDVDARGSGASGGTRPHPWSRDEVADGAEIVDWIVAQSWSNGRVGTTGVSYDGTAAEFLGTCKHPAVRAVAPRFSLFDVYPDIAFPGGVHLTWFTENWARSNAAIDSGRRAGLMGRIAQALSRGVRPVDGAPPEALTHAMAEHAANANVHAEALALTFRDDPSPSRPHETIDVFSPHAAVDALRASGAAVYGISGWMDGAYPLAAIKRFAALDGADRKLTIGPWEHGGDHQTSPFDRWRPTSFDHTGELLRFFDHHLLDVETGVDREPRVHYYTLGEESWKAADNWPPPGTETRTLHLASGDRLTLDAPAEDGGADIYPVDFEAGTGARARWNCLIFVLGPVGYYDRAERDLRLRCYTSAPLDRDWEVTGHPVVTLHIAADAPDAAVFAYLEDVDPRGRVHYVTEGMLRALLRRERADADPWGLPFPHRSFTRADAAPLVPGEPAELRFDLLPISYRFFRGHRIRLALAGADADHFAPVPDGARTLTFHRSTALPSRIELPVMPAAR